MDRHIHFYEAIKDIIPLAPFTLIDYCCGDASLGTLFDDHPFVQEIIFVDVKKVRGLERKISVLHTPFQLFLGGIESYTLHSNSFVVAVHACGTLTDNIIERAVLTRNTFVVMPCCYSNRMKSLRPSSTPQVMPVSYSRKEHYDLLRLQYAKEKSYHTEMRFIDRKITLMNHILVGLPLYNG